MKMPEPVGFMGVGGTIWRTEKRAKQSGNYTPLYTKRALIDLLEAAAVECKLAMDAYNIRKLKETI